jgi:tape measure domain-containing protein
VSVVANVAVNLDARGVTAQLAAIRQGSIGAADGFKNLQARAQAVKSIVEAQQGSFAKASTVQGVFAAKVKNTEFAIKAQIAALRDVQSKVQFNGALYQKAGQQIKQYEAVLRSANREEEKGIGIKGRLGSALGGLRGALVSIGAGVLVAGMVRGAAAAEQLQLRLKLLSREYGETERVQQFVAQSAKTFGQSQVEAAAGVADVYARLRPLGTSLAEIETVYKGFNAVALASGTSAEAASGAFLQLSQALGSGRLQGDEFRSIAEQVPGILKLVANEMGVTVGQLKQLGSEGKITSDVLINALAKGFEENKSKISELLALSPAQRFKEFKDSTQALSSAMGSELLPAIVPVVKIATELLRLFGQLPGPMKTIIAAAVGLTAAFVALAPAISATIGLLGGLSLATLAAAGPWIALAAGVTAAAVALASYRTESEKIGAKAAAGDPAAISAARSRITEKEREVALLKAQRPSPRSAKGGDLARAQGELAQLRRDVTTGQTAAAPTPTPTPTPTTATGTGTGKGTGAKKGSDDAKRAADDAAREAQRVADVVRDQQFITKQKGIQTKFAQLIFDAEQSADPIRVRQLQTVEALVLAGNETARQLEAEENSVARLAIARTRQGEAEAIRQQGLQDVLKLQIEQKKNFDEIIAGLDLELALKTATTEQAREQLRLAYELAKLQSQGFTPEQIGVITAKKTELARPKTDRERLEGAAAGVKAELDALTDPINMITTAAEGIGDAFSTSFKGIISGSMTAKEALGSFFKSVADMFLDMAAQIIAKMIQMAILNAIVSLLPGGSSGGGLGSSQFKSGGSAQMVPSLPNIKNYSSAFKARANGGPVSSGQTYMVGERGPELFVPGRSGTIVANDKMGGGTTNVVVNVDAKGSSVEGNEQGANQLGRVISAAVQSELIKQQRPGGILAR